MRAGGFPPHRWAHISFPPLHGGQPIPKPIASRGCSLTWDPVPRRRVGPMHKLKGYGGGRHSSNSLSARTSKQMPPARTPEHHWGSWKLGHPQSSLSRVLSSSVPPGNSLCTLSPGFMPACGHGPSQAGSPSAPSQFPPCPRQHWQWVGALRGLSTQPSAHNSSKPPDKGPLLGVALQPSTIHLQDPPPSTRPHPAGKSASSSHRWLPTGSL